ncbi:MAG: divergent polysaccharide deacetylase family protein [Proteobacteria bacterium]|nr:divergent polysaccharide deacetylase family protein [Pseudomonadota bacterium]MBI3496919.1 divergent polysaccharide deacetylase family protein [Pseudomonadota bacterium]
MGGNRSWVVAAASVFAIGVGLGMAMTGWQGKPPPIPTAADPSGPPPEYSARDRRALDRLMASAAEQPIYRAPPYRPGAVASRAPALASPPAPALQPSPPVTAPPAVPAPMQRVRPTLPPPPALSSLPPPPLDQGQPWRRYAVAVPPPDDRPMIAVVIDDAGVDRARTQQAIRLRAPLTIAFLPYAQDLKAQTEAAHAAGHELMVHVPMEPFGEYHDPGPNVLLVKQSRTELLHRLVRDLESFQGYVGINNHMGSRFTSNAETMGPVAAELKRRGLLFLDSRTTAQSVAFQVAVEHGVPSAVRDVFLDNEDRSDAVLRRLAELEQIARRQGHAIAIGHPREVTLAELEQWLLGVETRGFRLVPVSAVVMSRIMVAGELGDRR